MAHFRAVIKGARGEASRLGHKATGISTLLQTWGFDVRVTCEHQDGKDSASIELVNHSTGQRIPLLDLNLSANDYRDAVTFIYRTVDEKTSNANFPITLIGDPDHTAKQQEAVRRLTRQPKTGQPCACRPGIERDNCAQCEGTGQRIDFAAIRNAHKGA